MKRLLIGVLASLVMATTYLALAVRAADAVSYGAGTFNACVSPIPHGTLANLATAADVRGCDPTFLQYRRALDAWQNSGAWFAYFSGSTNGVPNTTLYGDYLNNPGVAGGSLDGFLYGARYLRWAARNGFAAGPNDAAPMHV